MPKFNDNLQINGNNYSRINTIVELSGNAFGTKDITQYVKGISYSQNQDKQFDYTLGSHNRPSHFGVGNITCEGSLSLTDAGLGYLNEIALSIGLPSMLYLGQDGTGMSITVSYTMYNDKTKTDKLEFVHFLGYSNGVNSNDVIYTREVALIIGKVNIGNIA